jgi:hypothetical protein
VRGKPYAIPTYSFRYCSCRTVEMTEKQEVPGRKPRQTPHNFCVCHLRTNLYARRNLTSRRLSWKGLSHVC